MDALPIAFTGVAAFDAATFGEDVP